MPSSCARPCHARVQLLLRDGRTRLGSRSGLRIREHGQVRVLVPVAKGLLERSAGKADAKGYRTLPVRLRVSTRAANGRWVTRVRAGSLRISALRIRSGKAPATTGRVY